MESDGKVDKALYSRLPCYRHFKSPLRVLRAYTDDSLCNILWQSTEYQRGTVYMSCQSADTTTLQYSRWNAAFGGVAVYLRQTNGSYSEQIRG